MRCALVLASVTAAACGGEPEPCHIDDVVVRFVEGTELVDCGDVAITADDTPSNNYAAARQCVLDALATQTAFRVDWTAGTDRRSFVSLAGEVSFFRMDVRPHGEAGALIELPTSRTTCVELRDMGEPCGVSPGFSLCIECDGPVERETCR